MASGSAEETFALGERLGRLLAPGDFVGLLGELGTGKTQLVRGVAEGAGVPRKEVASPSFAILYPYRGRIPLYHADLYRISGYDELYATGFFELWGGDGALLVEWLDRVPEASPDSLLLVELAFAGDDHRTIQARAYGARPAELLAAWLGQ
ncbi:MAG: tRNA (adenosine(37)-N6)-threonylcarbamoyltransferase complex ATPase subunit type 1 TsaE [Myxococcales bacterium]|nr:tRNA (adenosine(37)-N6)-threonylcarbamoyltransferase complex ATPase subunit type 1 TsaE [Myxococcales bacterium]